MKRPRRNSDSAAARAHAKIKFDTAQTVKDRIQELLRQIAIARDGGCILRDCPEAGSCGGYRTDGELILQYDHLVTRARSVSYGDIRLGVALCKAHHGGFKKWNKERYDRLMRRILPPERVALWDRIEADNRTYPMGKSDWLTVEIGLRAELTKYTLP
jgi:hypothetical protein